MKINPSQIQAYRNALDPLRSTANQPAAQGRTTGKAEGSKASPEIAGSKFVDMLSKAEKQYLAEKFDTAATRKLQSASDSGRVRGRLVDIRV